MLVVRYAMMFHSQTELQLKPGEMQLNVEEFRFLLGTGRTE